MFVFIAFLGVILGSFINAFVWRLRQQLDDDGVPRKLSAAQKHKLSITKGRSMCPQCRHILAPKDLMPVLSWLLLKGRCRYCGKPISAAYPIVELLTGLLFAVTYIAWPYQLIGAEWLIFAGFLMMLVFLIVLSIYDLRWWILPTRLIYTAAIVYGMSLLIGSHILGEPWRFWESLSAAGLYGVLFFTIYIISYYRSKTDSSRQDLLGFGDVRLAFVLGLAVGVPANVFLAMFLSSLVGLVAAVPDLARKQKNLGSAMPFGPFLVFGAWAAALWGADMVVVYSNLIEAMLNGNF